MAYDAKVLPVMIASPSDVADEREIVRAVLSEWNAIYSHEKQIVLLPIGWDTHSAPDLGGRPQELINERVLEHADLLVGIFWTRVGSHTGKAISGSVEEIEKHLGLKKPVMLYFSNRPVHPGSVEAGQYEELQKFKEWARGQGLIETFDSADEFRLKFQRQLPLTLRDNAYLKSCVSAVFSQVADDDVVTPTIDISQYTHQISLSEDAENVLNAAVSVEDGDIIIVEYIGGTSIQSGRTAFEGTTRRDAARWRAAVRELEEEGLVEAQGYKGEIFSVTHLGYQYAERRGWTVA